MLLSFVLAFFSPLLPSRPHALGSCSSPLAPSCLRQAGLIQIGTLFHAVDTEVHLWACPTALRHQVQVNVAIFRRLPIARQPGLRHALFGPTLLYIAAEPPDIEADCWPGSSPAPCSAHQHPAPGTRSPIWRFGQYSVFLLHSMPICSRS